MDWSNLHLNQYNGKAGTAHGVPNHQQQGEKKMKDDQVIAQIEQREAARCAALVNSDWEGLKALITDDVVHIHGNGSIEDKATYVAHISEKLVFLRVERPSLKVRVYGDMAIATGVLDQTVRVKGPETEITQSAATTQVWVMRDDTWLQASFQATKIG
jgi:ketosteroid isomerase-like protein